MSIDSKRTIKAACGDNLFYWVLLQCLTGVFTVIFNVAVGQETVNGSLSWKGVIHIASVVVAILLLRQKAHRQQAKGRLFTTVDSVDDTVLAHDRRLGLIGILAVSFMIMAYGVAWEAIFGLAERGLNAVGYTASGSAAQFSNYENAIPWMLYVGIIGPIAEELVWRGVVLRGLQPIGKNLAIVLSGVMFGLMHGNIYQAPVCIITGILWGYIAMEYSIYDTMILHIINNSLLNIALVYLYGYNVTIYNVVFYGGAIVGAVIILYLLARYHGSLREYIAAGHAEPGTVRYVWNIWFILFLILILAACLSAIKPL